MAKERSISAWDRTASLLCLQYNSVAPKGKKKKVEDFHPYLRNKKSKDGKGSLPFNDMMQIVIPDDVRKKLEIKIFGKTINNYKE